MGESLSKIIFSRICNFIFTDKKELHQNQDAFLINFSQVSDNGRIFVVYAYHRFNLNTQKRNKRINRVADIKVDLP